jgi:hypothetical protein
MPGHGYRVVCHDLLTSAWADLPGASKFAGPLQINLSYTDRSPTNHASRFYNVKLLH